MCFPDSVGLIQGIITAGTNVYNEVSGFQSQKDIQKNRQYVALTNIRNAQNQARQTMQEGIEKSRQERIEGMKNANKILAMSASSGFDANLGTNAINYQDVLNDSISNSNEIINKYKTKSDSYYARANSYMNNYVAQSNAYAKSNIYDRINSLGKYSKVALGWIPKEEEVETVEHIF